MSRDIVDFVAGVVALAGETVRALETGDNPDVLDYRDSVLEILDIAVSACQAASILYGLAEGGGCVPSVIAVRLPAEAVAALRTLGCPTVLHRPTGRR